MEDSNDVVDITEETKTPSETKSKKDEDDVITVDDSIDIDIAPKVFVSLSFILTHFILKRCDWNYFFKFCDSTQKAGCFSFRQFAFKKCITIYIR